MTTDERMAALASAMDAELAASAPEPTERDMLTVLKRHVLALEARQIGDEDTLRRDVAYYGHPVVLVAERNAWRSACELLIRQFGGKVEQ